MTLTELIDKVEAALAGRASYTVQLVNSGYRDVETRSYKRKRVWKISIAPLYHSVESATADGAYAAFVAALLPLVEPAPSTAQEEVGV